MPSLQGQVYDLHTYADNINTPVGNPDVASTARVLTLEAKIQALEAKHKLEGAQTLILRDQLKAKAAKIEALETQLAVQAAQVEMILARLGNAPDAPVAADSNMDDAITEDDIEMPIFKSPCTGCRTVRCPFLHPNQANKFSFDKIDALPLNHKERYEARKAQKLSESSPEAMEDAIALPKHRGPCGEEKARRTCKVEDCPWLQQVQINAFFTEAIEELPKNRAELRARARGDV